MPGRRTVIAVALLAVVAAGGGVIPDRSPSRALFADETPSSVPPVAPNKGPNARGRADIGSAEKPATDRAAGDETADGEESYDLDVLKTEAIRRDPESLLAFLRERTPTDAARRRTEARLRNLGDPSFVRREQATLELIRHGVSVRAALQARVLDPDLEVARRVRLCLDRIDRGPGASLPIAVVRMLARSRPHDAAPTILAFLPAAEDESVENEIFGVLSRLYSTADGGPTVTPPPPELLAALRSRDAVVRAAAGHVLGRSRTPTVVAAVRPLLNDPDPRVRYRTARARLAAGDPGPMSVLIALVGDGPAELGWHAEEYLYRLAGDGPPALSLGAGGEAERARRKSAWLDWWGDHGKEVDVRRAEEEVPSLGLTLVAQMDRKAVWECGRDGRRKWEIGNLGGPIDAQMLPDGKVLVAEFQARRVSVRDRRGAIHWVGTVPGTPTVCRRLPTGNTFVATYSSFLEFSPAGAVVYRHDLLPTRGQFYCAEKLPDGRIIGLSNTGVLVELDSATGGLVRQCQLVRGSAYSIEAVPGDRFLVANYSRDQIQEVDASGRILWHADLPGAYHATRLANGNVLASSHTGRRVVEFNRAGQVVWETATDGHVWRVHRR